MDSESIEKLKNSIGNARFCMFTMVENGRLCSRPMSIQEADFEGQIWFLTGKHSSIGKALRQDDRVNLSIVRPGDNVYVSISGRARFVEDRAKTEELWSPLYKAWYPKGIEDPELQLMAVAMDEAEYWDAPNAAVVIFRGLKAALTGRPQEMGVHEKISG